MAAPSTTPATLTGRSPPRSRLLDLAGLAGASKDTTLWLIGTDFLMIVSGLIGALLNTYPTKWYFWLIGMMFFGPIVFYLVVGLNAQADKTGLDASIIFKKVAMLTAVSWSAYPLVWIFGEGTSAMSADHECMAYTVSASLFGLLECSALL